MSVRSRKSSVNDLVVQPLVTSQGTIKSASITSPTSGKRYFISIMDPVAQDNEFCVYYEYLVSCSDVTDPAGMPSCKGNSKHTVCKHSIAVLQERLNRKGIELIFCNSARDACRVSDLGGQVIKLQSTQGEGCGWFVGRRVRTEKPSKVGPKKGIEMMRGSNETID